MLSIYFTQFLDVANSPLLLINAMILSLPPKIIGPISNIDMMTRVSMSNRTTISKHIYTHVQRIF